MKISEIFTLTQCERVLWKIRVKFISRGTDQELVWILDEVGASIEMKPAGHI